MLAASSSRYRDGHATARLFRANLRAHSFRPPFDLIKSVRRCPAGFVFRAYRNTLDHLLRVLASTISESAVQKSPPQMAQASPAEGWLDGEEPPELREDGLPVASSSICHLPLEVSKRIGAHMVIRVGLGQQLRRCLKQIQQLFSGDFELPSSSNVAVRCISFPSTSTCKKSRRGNFRAVEGWPFSLLRRLPEIILFVLLGVDIRAATWRLSYFTEWRSDRTQTVKQGHR